MLGLVPIPLERGLSAFPSGVVFLIPPVWIFELFHVVALFVVDRSFLFGGLSAMTISRNIRGNLITPCHEPSRFRQEFTVQLNFVGRSRKRGKHPMARLSPAGYFTAKL
jgi:hypothetical protein